MRGMEISLLSGVAVSPVAGVGGVGGLAVGAREVVMATLPMTSRISRWRLARSGTGSPVLDSFAGVHSRSRAAPMPATHTRDVARGRTAPSVLRMEFSPMRAIRSGLRWPWQAAILGAVRKLATATIVLSLGGCASGMGVTMAGGGRHGGRGAEAAADRRLYVPDLLLARRDVLRLTPEQVVALQRLWDLQRDGQVNATTAARDARDVLTTPQRRVVEDRSARGTQESPVRRHH